VKGARDGGEIHRDVGALGERVGDPRLMPLVASAAHLSGLGWTQYRVERDST